MLAGFSFFLDQWNREVDGSNKFVSVGLHDPAAFYWTSAELSKPQQQRVTTGYRLQWLHLKTIESFILISLEAFFKRPAKYPKITTIYCSRGKKPIGIVGENASLSFSTKFD
jgi:hypothetical protein